MNVERSLAWLWISALKKNGSLPNDPLSGLERFICVVRHHGVVDAEIARPWQL